MQIKIEEIKSEQQDGHKVGEKNSPSFSGFS